MILAKKKKETIRTPVCTEKKLLVRKFGAEKIDVVESIPNEKKNNNKINGNAQQYACGFI